MTQEDIRRIAERIAAKLFGTNREVEGCVLEVKPQGGNHPSDIIAQWRQSEVIHCVEGILTKELSNE